MDQWAALLQPIVAVDPLACPSCHGVMRLVAVITQASVLDRILAHRRTRAATAAHGDARSTPSSGDRLDRAPTGNAIPMDTEARRGAKCPSPLAR